MQADEDVGAPTVRLDERPVEFAQGVAKVIALQTETEPVVHCQVEARKCTHGVGECGSSGSVMSTRRRLRAALESWWSKACAHRSPGVIEDAEYVPS